jgi:hypothetical protein
MVRQITAKSRFARALAAVNDWCLTLLDSTRYNKSKWYKIQCNWESPIGLRSPES